MSEGYLVRRGGSGGGAGDLAIFTGSTLPTNEPYGVYANTGTRNVNGIIVDMPVDSQYSLLTYVNTFNPRGIGINNEETQGMYRYGNANFYLYDIASNTSTIVKETSLLASGYSSCVYTGNNTYTLSMYRDNDSCNHIYTIDVDSTSMTDRTNFSLGNYVSAYESTLIQNDTVIQFLFATHNSSLTTSYPTVGQVDTTSWVPSIFWSQAIYSATTYAWCPDYEKDGTWWILQSKYTTSGSYRINKVSFIDTNGVTHELPQSSWFQSKPGVLFSMNGKLYSAGTLSLPAQVQGIGFQPENKEGLSLGSFTQVYEGTISYFLATSHYDVGFSTTSPTSAWWVSDTALNRFVVSPNAYPDNYVVVRSSRKSIYAHDLSTWVVRDKSLERVELSSFSKIFDESMIKWLDKYDDKQREDFVNALFMVFDRAGVNNLNDVLENKKLILKLVMETNGIDKKTRNIMKDFIYVLFRDFKDEKIDSLFDFKKKGKKK